MQQCLAIPSYSILFLCLTLKSSAIKANSVHRRLGLEIMYSKGCLATACDAGKAFLHKRESNGGVPLCVLCVLYIPYAGVGPATTTNVNTYRKGTFVQLQAYSQRS